MEKVLKKGSRDKKMFLIVNRLLNDQQFSTIYTIYVWEGLRGINLAAPWQIFRSKLMVIT